jgi:molybdopterin-guanine dinucleotide biosynthesis protein A
MAEIDGQSLLNHAIDALDEYCGHVVVAGRTDAPVEHIADWPRPDCGPLGGIAASLRLAAAKGFESVLTCGVDSVNLPSDLLAQLSPPPAYLGSQPVIGHWPTSANKFVERILNGDGRHSMLAFAKAVGAREVQASKKPANINTPADLLAVEKHNGL